MSTLRKNRFTKYIPYGAGDIMENVVNIDKVYLDLIKEIKNRYTGIKLVYGFLNQDQLDICEFILIYKKVNEVKNVKTTVYAIFNATKFGNRSLECFDLCRKSGDLDAYFKEFFDQSVVYTEPVFESLIKDELQLSLNKDDKKYWKNIENSRIIIDKLMELCCSNYTIMQSRR